MIERAYLITSGDLRLSANQACWPEQEQLEGVLTKEFSSLGVTLERAFPIDDSEGHGFISSQRMGMDVFASIPEDAPLVFATAAWQYSHHVLPGLRFHRGPILTVANWSGRWPGLVGLLNLNGSLVKAGIRFSTIWSETFEDSFFREGVRQWTLDGRIDHDLTHVSLLDSGSLEEKVHARGKDLAAELRKRKAILGVFDEGCMGMYNAIIDDELLNPLGVFKERLSQSALAARMSTIDEGEALLIKQWLDARGVTFRTGTDESAHLTDRQILEQCKMYIAAVRIAAEFGCDAIGIQYQQGLKDTAPASDLVEGLLNNPDRPPVIGVDGKSELYAGLALPHFNEVDEGAGVDALITNRVWRELGMDPSCTLHDVRWGEALTLDGKEEFVWVLQISGAAPASHFRGGYAGAISERQPAMYFPLGGGSLKGVGKAGEIVWSRVFVEEGKLHVDLGRGSVVELSDSENERRWRETTYEWPIVNTIFHGIGRDAFMARHRANHVTIAYGEDISSADNAFALKAAMFEALGVVVHICGTTRLVQR